MRQATTVLVALACQVVSGGTVAAGQEPSSAPRYRIKPSEVSVPPDVPIGMYRRVIHPFGNWTLICDENFKAKQKICNITQIIVDEAGNTVFSWSLAATAEGRPMIILRVPPAVSAGSEIRLSFADRAKPVRVSVENCDPNVCLGTVPVGPILRDNIARKTKVRVSYDTPDGAVSVSLPFHGLSQALEAIE